MIINSGGGEEERGENNNKMMVLLVVLCPLSSLKKISFKSNPPLKKKIEMSLFERIQRAEQKQRDGERFLLDPRRNGGSTLSSSSTNQKRSHHMSSEFCDMFLKELRRKTSSPKRKRVVVEEENVEKDVYNIENHTTSPSTVTSDDPKSPPRDETIAEKKRASTPSPRRENTWKCQRCTYLNANTCTMCTICQFRRPRMCTVSTMEKKKKRQKTKTTEKTKKKKKRSRKEEEETTNVVSPFTDYKDKLVKCFQTHFKGEEVTTHDIVDKLMQMFPSLKSEDKRSRYVSICKSLNQNPDIFDKNVRTKSDSPSGLKFAYFRYVQDDEHSMSSVKRRKLFQIDTTAPTTKNQSPISPPRLKTPLFKDGPCICGRMLSNCIRKEKKQHLPKINMYLSNLSENLKVSSFQLPESYNEDTERIRMDSIFIKDSSLCSSRCLPSHLARKRRDEESKESWNRDRFVLGSVAERACTSCIYLNHITKIPFTKHLQHTRYTFTLGTSSRSTSSRYEYGCWRYTFCIPRDANLESTS